MALPGGMAKKNVIETPSEVCTREFKEETGCETINFSDNEYLFSFVTDKALNHYFVKIVRDDDVFSDILLNFHLDKSRKGYVDEIFGTIGFPLWLEGPIDTKSASLWGDTAVWGLARFLSSISSSFRERDQLLVLLLKAGVISTSLCRRIFDLVNAVDTVKNNESLVKKIISVISHYSNDSQPLPTYSSFMKTPGLADLLTSDKVKKTN